MAKISVIDVLDIQLRSNLHRLLGIAFRKVDNDDNDDDDDDDDDEMAIRSNITFQNHQLY